MMPIFPDWDIDTFVTYVLELQQFNSWVLWSVVNLVVFSLASVVRDAFRYRGESSTSSY